jgi:hypothetical protein
VVKQTDNRVSPARETTFDYAAAGLPAQDANDPNGATKITVGAPGSAPSYTRVDFYTHGQRTRVEEGVGADLVTRRFTYDPATGGVAKSEVLAVAPATWKTEAEFTFDGDGNRLTATDGVEEPVGVHVRNDRGSR